MEHQNQNPQPETTSDTAAGILKVAESTLRKSRVTGELLGIPAPKYYKLGRRVRYLESDLHEWIESNTVTRDSALNG